MSIQDIAAGGQELADNIDNPKPLFKPQDASIKPYLEKAPPPREFLLKDLLPLNVVGAIVGPGGVSKSYAVLDIGRAVATGRKALGTWEVETAGKALVLFIHDAQRNELGRLELLFVVGLFATRLSRGELPCHANHLEASVFEVVRLLRVQRQDAEREIFIG